MSSNFVTLNFELYHPTIISATSAAEVIIHAGSTTHSTKHSVPCTTPSNNTAHPKDDDSVTEPESDDVIPEENGLVMESEEEEEEEAVLVRMSLFRALENEENKSSGNPRMYS
ncbi:hypothetical protein L208DRAFT_1380006 [Tricholoma matsutake]|nr:hypothetical protein L208DRAFT_1380006 [Tricholoma matsutake 945]